MRIAVTILSTAMLAMGALGCHGAAYEKTLAHRQQTMHDHWTQNASRDAGRPANLKRLRQTSDDLQALYAQRLELTLERIEDGSRENNERWRSEHAKRLNMLQEEAEGHPNWIEKFIEDVFH